MGNVVSSDTLETALPITAVLASGVVTGFLSAVTFLDVRTFNALVAKKDAELSKNYFRSGGRSEKVLWCQHWPSTCLLILAVTM